MPFCVGKGAFTLERPTRHTQRHASSCQPRQLRADISSMCTSTALVACPTAPLPPLCVLRVCVIVRLHPAPQSARGPRITGWYEDVSVYTLIYNMLAYNKVCVCLCGSSMLSSCR